MTVRLTVDTEAWEQHLASVVDRVPGLVPVVKGNGYGFGRRQLAQRAAGFADTVAVGTVHELAGLGGLGCEVVVLTPSLRAPAVEGLDPILTVSTADHVEALAGSDRRVLVKLASSMQRYGAAPDALAGLIDRADRAGLDVIGAALHLPLAGTDADRLAEARTLLGAVNPAREVWLSHLAPEAYAELPATHRYRLRLGTLLWHGDKSMLHLGAEVLETRPIRAGTIAGYHRSRVTEDGTLVMIGAGTAHGVHPLPDGRSPFHHRRTRLALLEPPHMHTSMAIVPAGSPAPTIGELVDVQRPLTTTWVDEIAWR